jgi:hypothetical protein
MTQAANLQITDVGELPQYPIDRGERLESHSFFLFHYDRYLNSDLYVLGDWDIKGIAHALWCKAQDQDPVGTLPDNPRLIAGYLGMSTDVWDGYMRRDPGPLHGWTRCLVGNEVRLMHDVVTEVALAALGAKTKGADRKSADAERQRIKRLGGAVERLGLAQLAGNEMFIAQLDRWLEQNFPGGNRTVPRILEGLEELGVRDLR